MNFKFNAQHVLKSHFKNVRFIIFYYLKSNSSLTFIIINFYDINFYDATFRDTIFHCAFIKLFLLILISFFDYLYFKSFI